MQVGFVGLGAMGNPMARNLSSAEYDVTAYDLDEDALAAVVEDGAKPAENVQELAREADVVFLSLPTPDAVEAVVLGEDGLGDALETGDVLVDVSTSRPDLTRDVATVLRERGVDVLSAPVSGGPSGAEAGTLSTMVGGSRSAFERCEDLLEVIAEDIVYVGADPAHGHALKLVNNYLKFAGMVAAAEAFVVGRSAGLALETQLEVINVSSGRNGSTETTYPNYVEPGSYDSGFTMELMNKDMGLFASWAAETDVATPLAGSLHQHLRLIGAIEGDSADYTRMYRFYESTFEDE